jgi:REP element-mobilizing transposase RayT
MKTNYYERNLPHWHPSDATFFLTYRLAGSIPAQAIQSWKTSRQEQTIHPVANDLPEKLANRRKWWLQYDGYLDAPENGPYWLKEPAIAQVVKESLLRLDPDYVKLYAFTIMPNHVHVLLHHPAGGPSLASILQRHKGYTGAVANKLLGRKGGPFWQRETYDHVVRTEAARQRILRYILMNPVKAGLVRRWEDWAFTHRNHQLSSWWPEATEGCKKTHPAGEADGV